MLLRAAVELKLDLAASWMVGDLISDVIAGLNAGCRSILVDRVRLPREISKHSKGRALILRDLEAAAAVILANQGALQ